MCKKNSLSIWNWIDHLIISSYDDSYVVFSFFCASTFYDVFFFYRKAYYPPIKFIINYLIIIYLKYYCLFSICSFFESFIHFF